MPCFSGFLNWSQTSAVCKRAFVGMQPTRRHVPPNLGCFSMSAVVKPYCPARTAAEYPPGPLPITTAALVIFDSSVAMGSIMAAARGHSDLGLCIFRYPANRHHEPRSLGCDLRFILFDATGANYNHSSATARHAALDHSYG